MDLDELDIYDDLDTFQEAEEKKSNELLALEAKYTESLKTLEDLQKENANLKKQIKIIGINFQNLLDTAKAEIKRKDKQIEQLRKEKDDICFRRKQPRSEYDSVTIGTNGITDNWYKREQIFATHDAVVAEGEYELELYAGHARDPRMCEQKYPQRDGKAERKFGSDIYRETDMQLYMQRDKMAYKLDTHNRYRDATRNHSRDRRDTERGGREERERRVDIERKDERGRREMRKPREERDHRELRDPREQRKSKEKHKYNSKHECDDRRQRSLNRPTERIRRTSKEDKSRSKAREGSRQSRKDYKKIHEDTHKQRSKDAEKDKDSRAKPAKAADTKKEKVKHIGDAVRSSKDAGNERITKKANGIETTNKNNNLLCNNLTADKDTENNSLTKEKLLALEHELNDKNIDPNFNCSFPLGDMATPKKAALFNSLFGSTPSNAEKVNNTLLNDVMVLLKNNNYEATTSPSTYTDASCEPLILQTTKNNTKMSDIDECFVLNKDSEQMLDKNGQLASAFPAIIPQEEIWVDKALENAKRDKNAAVILLSDDDDDDEDESDVIDVDGEASTEQSKQSVEQVAVTRKGKIQILENIRLPNIYEIRAQQRRLREEAAKNAEIKKKAREIGMKGKSKKDADKGQDIAEHLALHAVNISNISSEASKLATTTGTVNQIKIAAGMPTQNKVDLIEKKDDTNVNQNNNSVFGTKDENNAEQNGAEPLKPNSVGSQMSIEKPIIATTADAIHPEKTEGTTDAIVMNQIKTDSTEEPNKLEVQNATSNKNVEEHVEKEKQKTTSAEYSNSQNSVNDEKIEMEIDLTEESIAEKVANTTKPSTPKAADCGKWEDDLIEIMSSDNEKEDTSHTQNSYRSKGISEPKNTTINECLLIVELSDDEEAETSPQIKSISENLISEAKNESGSYNNNSTEKVGIEEILAKPEENITNNKDLPIVAQSVKEKEGIESATKKEIEPKIFEDKGAETCMKVNINKESKETAFSKSLKINGKSTEETIEGSNVLKHTTNEDACKLNNIELIDTKIIEEKTVDTSGLKHNHFVVQSAVEVRNFSAGKTDLGENNERSEIIEEKTVDTSGLKHTDFVVQSAVKVRNFSAGKTDLGENNERSESKNNQDSGNAADKELEDAVAYLVNNMGVENQLYLDEDSTKLELELKDNAKLQKANGGDNDQNLKDFLAEAKDTDMELSNYANLPILDEKERELSKTTEVKLSRNTEENLLNNTDRELSKNTGMKLSQNTEVKPLPNTAAEITNNSNMELPNNGNIERELSQKTEVKLLNNTESELSQNTELNANVKLLNNSQKTKVKLLPNLVPEQAMNASLELLKIENSKLLNNANPEPTLSSNTEREHSKNKELKLLSNTEPKLAKKAKLEHSKNSNGELSQVAKTPLCPSILSTERNVLVDNMKRSEILWKFKIPKLSAKRKRENNDETNKANDRAVNGELDTDNMKKNENINVQIKQDNPLNEKDSEDTNLYYNKSKKVENRVYFMPDEIVEIVEIPDDIELIETRLLTGQTPEEKRTLSADREKSERIIKEIDNWARRKVGDIPDIIESALLMETSLTDAVKVKESVEESSGKAENKKVEDAKDERTSVKSTKSKKNDSKMELKIAEKAFAPLLTLKLCEQHEKENEKQLANGGAVKNDDFKTEQIEHLMSKRSKYEHEADKKRSETHVKNKTDTQKRGTERKTEMKSEKLTSNKCKDKGGFVEETLKCSESRAENSKNKIRPEQSFEPVIKKQTVSDEKEAKLEIKGERNEVNRNRELDGRVGTVQTKSENGQSPIVDFEDKVKTSNLKENSCAPPLKDKPKLKEQKEMDRESSVTLKRAGEACKTNLTIDIEEADTPEKRARHELEEAKKGANALTITESAAKNIQVPATQTTKAIDTAIAAANTTNHSTTKSTTKSIDKPITTKLNNIQRSHKRQRLDTASDNEELEEEVMSKPRKRKRCQMRIEDSDDEAEESPQTTMPTKKSTHMMSEAVTTENKDILAILQNDSVNGGNNDSIGVPAPQTPSSLPADVSQDEQYREIDSRMQLMFGSPKITDKTEARDLKANAVASKVDGVRDTRIELLSLAGDSVASNDLSASTPLTAPSVAVTPCNIDFNVSDTCFSDFNSNSFQASSRNITIDETQNMDVSMNSSTLSDSSLSTKHISLGSSDYRFEKVSDNVVNLFITRKRRGRRKPVSDAAASTTTTKTNTIQTAT